MRLAIKVAYAALILLFISSCSLIKSGQKTAQTGVAALYQAAVADACYAEKSEICDTLWPISKNNTKLIWKNIQEEPHVLMLSWKQNISYYEPYLDSSHYNTGKYEIWVTPAPQLWQRMKQESYKQADFRLKQLLGLPPNSEYSYFVEFWVKPKDLFRPCPDAEVRDSQCGTCFPENTDQQHIDWINASRISRFYPCSLYNQYPWSQLGYTYDWNPGNTAHVGLSEYVIKTQSKVVIKSISPTLEYLNAPLTK